MKKQINNPSISVVLPVYNMEQFIGEAIESILHQTFSDFELIIIDDCSTDSTPRIINTYTTDNRVKIFRNSSNLGNYPSRNIGNKCAMGKYIAVMDGDDVSLPDRLKIQFDFLQSHPNVHVCGQSGFHALPFGFTIEQLSEFVSHTLLAGNCFIHSSLLMRRLELQTLGYYDEDYTYASDYDLLCRFALTEHAAPVNTRLINYRFHAGQISRNHTSEQNRFAMIIRRKYQLSMIQRHCCRDAELPSETELLFPEIGRAIFFHHYSRCYNKPKFSAVADVILENVINRFNQVNPLYLNGLYAGLQYLIRNGFIDAISPSILNEINTCLYY